MTILSPHICPVCQTSNPPQAAFCFGCGQSLGQVTTNSELLHQRYRLLHTFNLLHGRLSWSPDGQQLVSSSARIWDLATGQQVFAYTGHTTNPPPTRPAAFKFSLDIPRTPIPRVAAWSPDGNWIASGDDRGSVHVWAAQ